MSNVVFYLTSVTLCAVASATLGPMSQTLREEGAPDWVAAIPLVFSISFFLGMLYFVFRLLQAVRHR